MTTHSNPAEQATQSERLLKQEHSQLRRTNKLLEKKVNAHTQALNRTTQQLVKENAERIKTEKKLQNRIALENILTQISSKFINLTVTDIDNCINEALEEVGRFTHFDRVYIYLLDENGRSLKQTHAWQIKDHPVTFEDFKNLPATLFEDWLPTLKNQETLLIQNVAAAEHETCNELKLLALQGIQSALITPLIFGNETIGFLGLDSTKPTLPQAQENSEFFQMVGAVIVNALIRQKTEEALVEERNFAKQIMGTMGQGLVTTTIEGIFEYANPAYAKMLGCQPEEIIGKNILNFTYHEDHPKLIQAQMQNMEGVSCSYEARLCPNDGSWLYVLINSVPNFSRQGRIVGTIATITDLTERREAEHEVQAKAEEVELIYQAAVQLLKLGNLKDLAKHIATITVEELGFDSCGVLLLHQPIRLSTDRLRLHPIEESNYLTWLAGVGGIHEGIEGKIALTEENGLISTAVRQGEIIYAHDVFQDTRYVPESTYTQSQMVIPLRAYNHIIGAIDLQSPHRNGFNERSRRIMTIFAENASLALETVRLYDQLHDHAQELEQQIGERKKIEQALRSSEHRYKQLVENATDMIYRTDSDGYCTYANPVTVRTLGYTDETDLIGRHFTEFIHPDFKVKLIKLFNKQKAQQISNTYVEFLAINKKNNEIWLGQNVQVIMKQGQVSGYQALARDITKQRKVEEKLHKRSHELNATNAKLARALRTKDEFLANMSHELRTPLSAILGKSEILQEGIHGPLTPKQISSLQVITDSGNHLLDLINDILDVVKIELGKVTLEIQTVSLATICESSLQFVRQMAHKKQIKLHANIDHSLKTCQADERRLKQILINLLSNAVKFTPAGGEVGINILNMPEREAVQFQIWDSGIGIPKKDMDRLFKPFVQLDSGLARSHEGTGLGLSLVYHLAEMHGGGVSLESQVGLGSCFSVTLPQNPQINTATIKEQARSALEMFEHQIEIKHYLPNEGPLILLVEDNETNIETVSEYLYVWGYNLTVAQNGSEALRRAREEQPDLILIDVQIPEIDGLTVIHQLRQEKVFQDTPIVALTALAMNGDRERCLGAGANEYLSKPIQLRQLVMIINQLLTTPNMISEEHVNE